MGEPVLIYGKSGSGKSRSLKNFAEDEIYYVNVGDKSLPFRKKFKYTTISDNTSLIRAGLQKMPTKTAVIDDAGFILANQFMDEHSKDKRGGDVYKMYDSIADNFWALLKFIKTDLPKDVIVYIIMHEDSDDFGNFKLRTIGKLLDNKVDIVGRCTIALRCCTQGNNHFFKTKTDGSDITKSPEDMFPEAQMENDLKAVDTAIRNYYEWEANDEKRS